MKVGDKVIAIRNFYGENEGDLSFERSDRLDIVEVFDNPDLITVLDFSGKAGIIPSNVVKLLPSGSISESWFHGRISRAEAENRLRACPNGYFLIRWSERFIGDFTLSVKHEKVFSYHIEFDSRGYTLDTEDWFASLAGLVANHRRQTCGLCCTLATALEAPTSAAAGTREGLIDFAEIEVGRIIGGGEFGEVHRGFLRDNIVALKRFGLTAAADQAEIDWEATILRNMSHPNILAFVGMACSTNTVFLVTEFMSNNSLLNFLRSRSREVVTTPLKIKFAQCVEFRNFIMGNILVWSHSLSKN